MELADDARQTVSDRFAAACLEPGNCRIFHGARGVAGSGGVEMARQTATVCPSLLGIHRICKVRQHHKYFFMRASTVARGNNASTASTDGVCVCPTSITRNGIASLGIFRLCLASNSFISA